MQLRLLDPVLDPVIGVSTADRMHFWRPLPWKLLDVVCGEGAALSALPFHAHEAMQLFLPMTPFAAIGGSGRSVIVRPGSIHVTTPLELCAARTLDDAPFTTRMMLIGPALLAKLGDVRVRDVGSHGSGLVVPDAALHAELTAIFEELRRPLVDLDCVTRLLESVRRLVASPANDAPATPARAPQVGTGVLRAREHLRERAVEHVTLTELARVAELSKCYLLRAFQRAFGLTPLAYQMQLRLARARRLLAEGRPVSHVAYDAGFADQSHLTRRFAAFYGLTPARFARQLATPLSAAPVRAAAAGWTSTSAA
jgi:AraC-like DNA-binding protein